MLYRNDVGGCVRRWVWLMNCHTRKAFVNRRNFIRIAAPLLAAASLAGAAGAASAQVGAPAKAATVLVLGDSLSAEYGIARGSGWASLLQQKLAAEKQPAQVVNASISGDTTAGGRARLPALLQRHAPAVLVIALGSNDALRGLPQPSTEANLRAMAQAARQAGARVLLAGVQLPPNYGATLNQQFSDMFARVAQSEGAALLPFLLKGVADRPDPLELFQPDRIHPTAEAQPIILSNVWPVLAPLLKPGK